ncbi:MAG TPA: glycosyltransferase family 4 protein [Fimbriimonadaceae bacterium]|nr:glycosyltransferase family 4 protein [Fimbriimonadaceae bacterium]
MKVLQAASSLYDWGGIERYVHYLDQGLTARNHEVLVVCPDHSPLAARSKHFASVSNRFKYSMRTYIGYRRVIQEWKPDIVHTHFSPDFFIPARVARSANTKCVMTRHLVLPWKSSRVKQYSRLYDGVIPVSEAVKRALVESGFPESKLHVAKAGVPNGEISSVSSPLPTDPVRIGFFGRLVEEKGVDVLIRAIQLTGTAKADIYGTGPSEPKLQGLAKELNLSDRVKFHGFVEDVGPAMASVDAVCVPSVWQEAFPYSVLEAMALGKAVIASNVGGIPEVVQDGVTGWLFPQGDARVLSHRIEEIRDNRTSVRTMGEAAQSFQRSEYTIDKMAERIGAVYDRLLS